MSSLQPKVVLSQDKLPTEYYNIRHDLPEPLPPPLDPGTMKPVSPEPLLRLFAKECVMQEASTEEFIPIPDEVRQAYLRLGRPTPLHRATRLEQELKTPAKIFFKREDLNPVGSHKPNTAIPQAYFRMKEGTERLTTETGAGQWGSALALATALFDIALECKRKNEAKTILFNLSGNGLLDLKAYEDKLAKDLSTTSRTRRSWKRLSRGSQ
jgi:tryptophan synthase beta chain